MELLMEGKFGPLFEEHLGIKYEVTSIVKPSARLANFAVDLGKHGNDFTKRHHIIGRGPGNSLVINYHYSIGNDISFTAEFKWHEYQIF
jgi:hypothetical protein